MPPQKGQWLTLTLVIACRTRALLGWHLPRSGKATNDDTASELVLIARFRALDRADRPALLRSDNGKLFVSRHYQSLVCKHGLEQEFLTPYCPQQNGMIELYHHLLRQQAADHHTLVIIDEAQSPAPDMHEQRPDEKNID